MTRTKKTFDFCWRFHKDDVEGAEQADYDDSSWRVLDLPHDWSIEGPFDETNRSSLSLAYLPGGIGWYRKAFALTPGDSGKRIFIEFDGIYRFSDVWINGHHLGFFPDGYTSFQYEMTKHVVFEKENIVIVRVDNSQQPNSRWYSGSGIYRHVWLTMTAPVYIEKDTTYITTPDVKRDASSMLIRTSIRNESNVAGAFMVNVEILDAAGAKVAEKSNARYIDPGTAQEYTIPIRVYNTKLWDIDCPYLYTAHFSVYQGQDIVETKVIDRVDVQFGFRTIEFDKDKGFFLNGKRVKIKGVALHHEAGLLGAAVPDRVWERRLEKLREMGCNSIRNAHSACAPELLDMCDRLGLMVFNEMHDEWKITGVKNGSEVNAGISKVQDDRYGASQYFDEWCYKNTAAIIRRDRNHPSVILWGIGNEIYEQSQSGGYLIARSLHEICHVEDPTRPTITANNRIHSLVPGLKTTTEFLESTDIIGFNYTGHWDTNRRFYFDDKSTHPHWKIMGTENVNLFSYRGDYSLEPAAGTHIRPYYMSMLEAAELWKFTKLYDYVMGDYIWTGIDYLGEWPWPNISAPCGMLDTCGFEKDAYYFFASQWSDKPIIKLIPHWNWPGEEGTPIPVICFTNCDEVELYVNGQSYGKQAYNYFPIGKDKSYSRLDKPRRVTTNDLHIMWTVPYMPGEIRVVGTKNGQVFEDVVYTCGHATDVQLIADRKEIMANSIDICHIEVKLLDAQGRFARLSNDRVKVRVEGAGEVLCLDNGSPTSHEIGMYADGIQTFYGMCIAYIRACKPGDIYVTVSGNGITPQSLIVKAI